MSQITKIHNSVCEHCGEGKTKAETTQGIVACTTCGAEDPGFVSPLISESDFYRDTYKRRGGTEKIHSFGDRKDVKHSKHREYARMSKKEKELLRDRCEDTSGYSAEYDDINNNPNLSDSEIRIALCDARRRYVKQKMDFWNEIGRWNQEIHEEEERRAELAKSARTTEESKETPRDVVSRPPSEPAEPSVSESESEDFGSNDSDSD